MNSLETWKQHKKHVLHVKNVPENKEHLVKLKKNKKTYEELAIYFNKTGGIYAWDFIVPPDCSLLLLAHQI